MARNNRNRQLIEDGQEFYKCSKCQNYFTRDNFYSNSRTKYNVSAYCKDCTRTTDRQKRANIVGNDDMGYISFRGINEEQKKEVQQVFKRAGYDTTKEIYPQFRQRVFIQYGILLD